MNDDDTDSGGDFFVDALMTLTGVCFVVLVVATVGAVVWEVL
jgi:hypothetical protein